MLRNLGRGSNIWRSDVEVYALRWCFSYGGGGVGGGCEG